MKKNHKIRNLGKIDDYVYDIETETHDLYCGFLLIVLITDSFVLSANTKDVIKKLKNLEDMFDFSNLDEKRELIGDKNKNITGFFKIETPKINWIYELFCLGSKLYSFKGEIGFKNKLKRIS